MATDLIDLAGHEQVAFCTDPATGLRAVIALHDTALGPGLGGTRFHPYPSMDAALADVLRLSRAMTSKNAVAGLDHGGGKAVILGDPQRDKTPELLRAYGRFVESLGGRYVTACDVGTYVADMDVVGESTRWATGRSPERGGAGDSSVLTAYGVFQGMRAAAQHVWGDPSLRGRRVAVAGVGKVGRRLAEHLLEDGADVVVTDVDPDAVRALLERHPTVRAVRDLPDLLHEDVDVFSPNALGGRAGRPHRRGAAGPRRLRRGEQPARHRGERRVGRADAGARDHLRPGLPRQRRRRHPGERRAARLRHGTGPGAHGDDLRPHPRGAGRRRRRRTSPPRWPPTGSRSAGSPPVDLARGFPATPSGCARADLGGTGRAGSPLSGTTSPEPLHSCTVDVTTHTRFPGPLRDVG